MNMTFGYELELGDVLKSRNLPNHFGTWEWAERDIVNVYPPYRGVASDPLGENPPVGGEINVHPARSPEELADLISEIINWFHCQGDNVSAGPVNHGHVHVRVPGLRDDLPRLKRLTQYIRDNQQTAIWAIYNFQDHAAMSEAPGLRTYLKWDGGRPMPNWMCDNILNMARNFDDFIRIQCCGKNGIGRGRPFRYAVNTYCLKHTDTIEFRLFRASLSHREIFDSIRFVEDFMIAAQYGGPNLEDLLHNGGYQFPPFVFERELCIGWWNTRHPKERGSKKRQLVELSA